jgi:hypothetical protein
LNNEFRPGKSSRKKQRGFSVNTELIKLPEEGIIFALCKGMK